MEGLMMNYPLTLVHLLERVSQYFPRVEVVSRLPDKSITRYTYADFYRRTHRFANALRRLGVEKGDRIATLAWNHYRHLEAYFAIPATGAVLHTLNPRLHPSDLAYIMNHAGDRILLVDDVLLPVFERFRAEVHPRHVIVWSHGQPVPEGFIDYEALIEPEPESFAYPEIDENQAAGMCYTSGTTGRPKGVVYSHRAIVLHSLASALVDTLAVSQRDVVMPVVPMFHANAWGIPFTAVLAGAKQVFPGPHLDPDSLLSLMESEQVTFTAGVPTIWLGILDLLDRKPDAYNLKSLRAMVVGGAAAPQAMIEGFEKRHGLNVVHAWGMTETTPLGTVSRLKRHLEALPEEERYRYRAMQGYAVPFVEVRAVGDSGPVPWDGRTMGELQVRGPWIASSYFENPAEADKFTPDGWFRTGDIVTIDPEGYVRITDRAKDLIKSGGEWISSVDLENAIMGHPAVKEAAVVAVPHPKWGERPLAVVVLREGAQATADELRAFLEPRFAKWWLPDAFVFTDQIPRTAAGKFLKSALREQYRDYVWENT
ncbi:long-chain fatty acid--CoA ligase [Caldinitratiruptor microaerophilus]|uniref:Long-chain-fatty-acid--CoA ligase n=1 Tax=Caldinitratiruptor microaerophilus TaxID=671077 RepID=A0AA35G8T3_9FIRM|nr:long-chain fatty acid--CoA ligase [Caldinitratiruptor microaerophilus]BDG59569.1 long-chain-fatty-acid--CoA ligase [Caldinitratiruptor microaerophilus]